MKKVFVVVLNYNGKKDTLECLESLGELRITNYEVRIVVVDNGSKDGSVGEIKKMINGRWLMVKKKRQKSIISHQPLTIKLIENKKNLGFAEGNNVGIRFALKNGADFVLILNNDTLVDKNLIRQLLEAVEKYPKGGIFGPKIYFAKGFEFHKNRYSPSDLGRVIWYAGGKIDWQNILFSHRGVDEVDRGQYNKVEETDFVSGCAMFVRREVFDTAGLFDPKYFAYLEDADFCQKAKNQGLKLFYVPSAFLWHKVARSSGGIGSSLQDYYITRNRLLFAFRFASFRTKCALLRESMKFLLKNGVRRKAVLDFYLRRFGKGKVDEEKD